METMIKIGTVLIIGLAWTSRLTAGGVCLVGIGRLTRAGCWLLLLTHVHVL